MIPPLQNTGLPHQALPSGVLMSQPDHFEVVDIKNPFMKANVGSTDSHAAAEQWLQVRNALLAAGLEVHIVDALPGCEDMVFTANPALCGLDASNQRICVLSRMRHPSRQREVGAHASWFAANGYRIVELDGSVERFEGGGDAIWHPARALLWIGAGPRTSVRAHKAVGEAFGVPVIGLELAGEQFYHLDTCFCPINEHTVLVYPSAFTPDALKKIHDGFADVITVGDFEANSLFACNATACLGKTVIMQARAYETAAALEKRGIEVVFVETAEFIKAGGSVYCMKAYLF